MKTLKEIKIEVVEEDEEGYHTSDLSAPTIDLVIEKLGAFERSREKEGDIIKINELE